MKHTTPHISWFTLIEVLVSITIFSIIMISVITIFIFSSNLSAKVDINRAMQENIKNAVETMAEDIRKYWIQWISDAPSDCSDAPAEWKNKLCIRNPDNSLRSSYRLKKNDDTAPNIHDIDTMSAVLTPAECLAPTSHCVLFKDGSPLTNSFVTFRNLSFSLSWEDGNQKKITINFVMQPAIKKWVRRDLIENSSLIFQTTLSERLIKSN